MSVSKIFSYLKLPLLLSFIAVSLLACNKMVVGTSTDNMQVIELSEKEKLEQTISNYNLSVEMVTAARDKAKREANEAYLELEREKQLFRNEMNQHWNYRAKPGDHDYRLCNGAYNDSPRDQGDGTGGINCSYEADLYMAENVKCARGNICGCQRKGFPMDESCMAHKAKKKVIEEKFQKKVREFNRHTETLTDSDELLAMKKEADAAQKRLAEIEEAEKAAQAAEQKRLAEIEEAEKAAQAAEQLANETAVEAYTEQPRWEGATDYSQSCSSSSGDLGCGVGG